MINDIHYNSDLASKRWFGYFDLLGVEKLIEQGNPISIFVAFSSAIEIFKERVTAWGNNVGYAWFSDTFIIYTDDDSAKSFDAIDNISRHFLYSLIYGYIPVRGAISCDTFYADRENNLFFGKAFIEAHEYGEAQDWIGFLLCPSAEERLKHLVPLPAEWRLNYAYADIPFKKQQSNLNQNLSACIIGKWVSHNNQNPIIERLSQMKERIVDANIRSKYDRAIEFIRK